MFAVFLSLSACTGLGGEPEIARTLPPPPTQDTRELTINIPAEVDLANGAAIFAENCTACHGENGNGRGTLVQEGQIPAMASFLNPETTADQSPADYYRIITQGNLQNLMPPWGDALSEQERWDVTMYTYQLASIAENPEMLQSEQEDASEPVSTAIAEGETSNGAPIATEEADSATNDAESPDEANVAETGRVTGSISNGTPGGTVPPDLPVSLRYGSMQRGVQQIRGEADENGNFVFEDVPFDAQNSYFVVTEYRERVFVSDIAQGNQDTLELPLTIYELTDDRSVIEMRELDLVVEPLNVPDLGSGLVFDALITYENTSDRMFTLASPSEGARFISLLVQMPPGSMILNDPNGQRYIVAQEENALIDTAPVLPGEHVIDAVFFVPYDNGAIVDLPLNNPLEGTLRLAITPETLSVEDERLQVIGQQTAGEAVFTVYEGPVSVPAGEALSLEISGTFDAAPSAPGTASGGDTLISGDALLPLVLIFVGAALLIAVAIYLMRRGQPNANNTTNDDPEAEINALVQQIAALDEQHANGQIDDESYENQRRDLKARLTERMRQRPTPPENANQDESEPDDKDD